jgi:hypothetical protein
VGLLLDGGQLAEAGARDKAAIAWAVAALTGYGDWRLLLLQLLLLLLLLLLAQCWCSRNDVAAGARCAQLRVL